MKIIYSYCMKLFIFFFLLIVGCIPNSNTQTIEVKYVIDGDTFVSEDKTRIRIWGIDSPEKNEQFYTEAKETLSTLISNTILNCNLIDTDKYSRSVMRCYLNDKDIAKTMVEKGMAKDFRRYSDGYYLREEIQAKNNTVGIWSN